MLLLYGFAFLAGIVTILSPCILPVLPIVLSSSLGGGKWRPFGVVLGFIGSFTFFTLALTAIVKATGLDADFVRIVAVVVLILFGVSMLVPKITLWLETKFSSLSGKLAGGGEERGGFWGGVVVGISLGVIWTPCAGPIMASVLTLALTSTVTMEAVIITLAYSVGTAIPMILIIFGGRALLNKVPFLLNNSAKIQKVFGVIIIVVAVGIYFNVDRDFQTYILEKFPGYGEGITSIEDNERVREALDELQGQDSEQPVIPLEGTACSEDSPPAPGFEPGGEWINSVPLDLEELRGKVVLVDFWTYTCINCIRTLPHLRAWHEKYSDEGLVIVGVHTPEFEFEKDLDNVTEAVEDFELKHPIVQDNEYLIWRSYNNRYWPAKYFVDVNGCIRGHHFGEGAYEESELFIQQLLEEAGTDVDGEVADLEEYEGESRTHERYLGYQRIEDFVGEIVADQFARYEVPEALDLHELAYGGEWQIADEKAEPKAGSVLEFQVQAREIFLVMRSEEGGRVQVSIDGEVVSDEAGVDVADGVVEVQVDRLYKLVKFDDYQQARLKLEFLDDGIEVFAFTFG